MKRMTAAVLALTVLCTIASAACAAPSDWALADGTYTLNGVTLSIKHLEEAQVLFAFEAGDDAQGGIFAADDQGQGIYEADGAQVSFLLANGAVQVEITRGEMPGPVKAGLYEKSGDTLAATQELAKGLVGYAGGLDPQGGKALITMNNTLLDYWFYQVTAVSADTLEEWAKYYLALDMSMLVRIDGEEMELVHGSAKTMMDYVHVEWYQRNFVSEEDNEQGIVGMDSPVEMRWPVVSIAVTPQYPSIGGQAHVEVSSPCDLPYSATIKSANEAVASPGAQAGWLDIHKIGSTVVSGQIQLFDVTRAYRQKLVMQEPYIFFHTADYLEKWQTADVMAEVIGLQDPPKVEVVVEDPQVVSYADGVITGLSAGETEIYAKAQGIGESERIRVLVASFEDEEEEAEQGVKIPWGLIALAAAALAVVVAIIIVMARRAKRRRS